MNIVYTQRLVDLLLERLKQAIISSEKPRDVTVELSHDNGRHYWKVIAIYENGRQAQANIDCDSKHIGDETKALLLTEKAIRPFVEQVTNGCDDFKIVEEVLNEAEIKEAI